MQVEKKQKTLPADDFLSDSLLAGILSKDVYNSNQSPFPGLVWEITLATDPETGGVAV